MTNALPHRAAVLVPVLALLAGAGTVIAAAAPAYRTGAPYGHTGGFGEPHCGACHFQTGDEARGGATITAPEHYRPGTAYRITVTVEHPELRGAGFQLAVRFAGGDAAGTQAGVLEPVDGRAAVDPGPGGVRYAGHTEVGAAPAGPGIGRWTLRWIAPDVPGEVIFHAATNASNDDASEFGDHILLARHTSRPEAEK